MLQKRNTGITTLNPAISTSKETGTLTTTRSYTGPYAELVALQADIRALASTTTLTPTDAGQAKLDATYADDTSGGEGTQEPEPTYEIDWATLTRAIETHPLFATLPIADLNWVRKEIAENANFATLSGVAYEEDELALQLYTKLARGQTDYNIATPIVRATTYHTAIPTSQGAWFRDEPPIKPTGTWEYLKTADRVTKQGRIYTRTQEWSGAKTWDPDIYT